MAAGPIVAIGGGAMSLVVFVVVILGGGSQVDASGATCGPAAAGIGINAGALPVQRVGNFGPAQLVNAVAIINAGKALGLSARDQTIGVMTAIGESSLTVIDHGDIAGPDSRGLFQQRANGAWGSFTDRMNPTISATNFFKALATVQGRDAMAPTAVAHAVQANADPTYYAQFWDSAAATVTHLGGVAISGISAGTGSTPCTDTQPLAGSMASGWVRPNAGPLTSGFGMRSNPGGIGNGQYRLHAGIDFGGACNTPILAAGAGIVVDINQSAAAGHTIVVDHGAGTTTRYLHMAAAGVMATVGEHVSAGTQIGKVGREGNATGCHLHFEVRQTTSKGKDQPIDPVPFLASRGISL
jgi:murein DD-endopeptidase MepM/ murein hydrolase activator NlpD